MVKLCDRLSELYVLLNYIEPEDWIKIPDEVIFYIKENKNNEYVWEYDETKELEEQNLSKDTFSLLTFIMYRYIATDEERKAIELLLDENVNSYQSSKSQQLANEINEEPNNNSNITETTEIQKDVNLIKIEENKENFFNRVIAKIKQIFNKN